MNNSILGYCNGIECADYPREELIKSAIEYYNGYSAKVEKRCILK